MRCNSPDKLPDKSWDVNSHPRP